MPVEQGLPWHSDGGWLARPSPPPAVVRQAPLGQGADLVLVREVAGRVREAGVADQTRNIVVEQAPLALPRPLGRGPPRRGRGAVGLAARRADEGPRGVVEGAALALPPAGVGGGAGRARGAGLGGGGRAARRGGAGRGRGRAARRGTGFRHEPRVPAVGGGYAQDLGQWCRQREYRKPPSSTSGARPLPEWNRAEWSVMEGSHAVQRGCKRW